MTQLRLPRAQALLRGGAGQGAAVLRHGVLPGGPPAGAGAAAAGTAPGPRGPLPGVEGRPEGLLPCGLDGLAGRAGQPGRRQELRG